MPEQLSQSQIDALLSKMSSGGVDAVENEKEKVKEYDFNSPKKFTKEQLKTLSGIHETFARMLSSYLSGILRISFDMQVMQIEEQPYYEYSNALNDNALIGVIDFKLEEQEYVDNIMLLDISTTLGFYLVDRLLGGSGESYNLSRDYTEIELAILTNVLEKISARLEDAWNSSISVKTSLDRIETNSRLMQVLAPEDTVVIVMMNILINSLTLPLNICIPAESLEDIIDNISMKYFTKGNKRYDPDKERAKKEMLLRSVCESDLRIQATFDQFQMELKDILQLQVSDVIPLNKKIEEDITLTLEGIPWFTAKLGETKQKKAVKLNQQIE